MALEDQKTSGTYGNKDPTISCQVISYSINVILMPFRHSDAISWTIFSPSIIGTRPTQLAFLHFEGHPILVILPSFHCHFYVIRRAKVCWNILYEQGFWQYSLSNHYCSFQCHSSVIPTSFQTVGKWWWRWRWWKLSCLYKEAQGFLLGTRLEAFQSFFFIPVSFQCHSDVVSNCRKVEMEMEMEMMEMMEMETELPI